MRFGFAAIMLAFAAFVVSSASPAHADEPKVLQQSVKNPDASSNPTASSVSEDKLFKELDRIAGRISIPDSKAGTLIQPEGREWRKLHQYVAPLFGAIVILGMLAALALFYSIRGRIRVEKGFSGINVLRFTSFERFVHWMTAVCFVILGLTGLNIVFGRPLLLPLVGPDAFSTLTQYGKYAHNYLGAPFALGIAIMFFMWVWQNLPSPIDWQWIKQGGGFIGKGRPPAKRFNFGQKTIFWSVVLIGGAISVTGFVLLFPFWGTTIWGMQLAQLVHSAGGLLLFAVILAHIYIGSLGMEGAFSAMGSGTVDLNWAREHHSIWAKRATVVDNDSGKPLGTAPLPAE